MHDNIVYDYPFHSGSKVTFYGTTHQDFATERIDNELKTTTTGFMNLRIVQD